MIIEIITLILVVVIYYKDKARDERIDDMEADLRILMGKKYN